MNPKTILTLGAVAVVAGGASLFVLGGGSKAGPPADARAGTAAFPDLRTRVNDVARVTLVGAGERLELARSGEGWGLADKGGYPVDVDKVKALVVGLSELEVVEEKTSNPALFHKLDLQDPGGEEVPSKRVTLTDEGGAEIADIVIGRITPARGSARSSLFVRDAGGGAALEVLGSVRVESSPTAWLDRTIAKIERKRVRSVRVTHPDGEVLSIQRESPDVSDFEVLELPEGAELSWAGVAGGIAGALEYLNLEDVEPASPDAIDPASAVSASFTTFDGLVLDVRSAERDGQVLLSLAARFDPEARTEPAGPPPPPEGEDAEPAKAPPELKPVEEVEAEAAELNERLGKWVYIVPGYAGSNLRKRMDDLLKKDEPAAPEGEDPFGGASPGAIPGIEGLVPVDEPAATDTPETPSEPPTDEPQIVDEPTEQSDFKPNAKGGGR